MRSSKGLSMANMRAELGKLTGPFTERPGKATTFSTPGSINARRDISLTTASVLSRDEPDGN